MLRFDRRLIITLCLLAGMFGVLQADAEQNASLPVFVVLRGQDMSKLDEFAACPNISGITLYFGWSVIEPKPSVYDFSRVTSAIEKANAHDKKVNLAMLPGRWSPAAVLQTARTMHWQQKDTYVENNPGSSAVAPVPWDPAYMDEFSKAITALGNAVKNEKLNSVAITGGSNTNGIEMDFIGSDTDLQRVNFNTTSYVAAWRHFVDAYATAFPTQTLTLAVHNQFGRSTNQEIPQQIENYARQRLGSRFFPTAFAFTGAHWFERGNPYVDLLLQYQQNNHFGLQALKIYSKNNDADGFQQMINKARQLQPAWLEIWPEDVRPGYWQCK